MRLRILNIESTLFDGDIREVNLMTESGEITVLDQHSPMVTLVRSGFVKIKEPEGRERIIELASTGFLEVEPEGRGITLLAA